MVTTIVLRLFTYSPAPLLAGALHVRLDPSVDGDQATLGTLSGLLIGSSWVIRSARGGR